MGLPTASGRQTHDRDLHRLGATAFSFFLQVVPLVAGGRDAWIDRMLALPTTVVSSTLEGPFDRPDVTVARGGAVEVVRRVEEESDVPIRSHGSLSVDRALVAAGLVDRLEVTPFPVVSGRTGEEPVFARAGDVHLDLLETRTLDGRTQELVHRPTPRTWPEGRGAQARPGAPSSRRASSCSRRTSACPAC